ncbi:MAG: Uma2 family endonuclease [Synechococcales cyanobacterium]
MITLTLPPALSLSPDAFAQLCRSNPEVRLERTANGELTIMAPTGSESGRQSLGLSAQLWLWNQRTRLGVAFDSSTGFCLPNGAIRSPDAAWIAQARWQALSPVQRRQFAPICPDFVMELCSPSDDLALLQVKMQEYQANGCRLGWLLDPERRQVWTYRPGSAVTVLEAPAQVSGDPELPGFCLETAFIWGDAGEID